jgi:protocatechuate 3,4-dioxygenase beta subunit
VVVDEAGRPVPGVEVRARVATVAGGSARREVHGTSGAGGRFWLGPLSPNDSYLVRASLPRRARGGLRIGPRAPLPERLALRLVLRALPAAFGRVLDESGRAVAGAVVVLLPISHGSPSPSPAVADEEGRFTLSGAACGTWELTAQAEGYAPSRPRRVTIAAAGGPADLGDVVLPAGAALTGVVVDPAGEPVPAAEVRALPADASAAVRVATAALPNDRTDGRGRFRLEALAEGASLFLIVEHPGYAPLRTAAIEVPPAKPLRLVLAPASRVAGRVVDDAGEPIAGALVVLLRAEPGLGIVLTAAGSPEGSARTDEEGRFAIEAARPGRARLAASAAGFARSAAGELDLLPGSDRTGVEVILRRGATLAGRVTGEDGRPVAGAWVRLVEAAGDSASPAVAPAGATTDEGGLYRLEGVPTGRQTIAAGDEAHPTMLAEVTAAPGRNPLDLRLAAGTEVGGQVVDRAGRPVAGAVVTLSTGGPAFSVPTGAAGTFELRGIPPGRYVLGAARPGYLPARAPDPVAVEGEPVRGLRLVLAPAPVDEPAPDAAGARPSSSF